MDQQLQLLWNYVFEIEYHIIYIMCNGHRCEFWEVLASVPARRATECGWVISTETMS
jgi:hypothetical protein